MTAPAQPLHAKPLASPIGRLVILGTPKAVTKVIWSAEAVAVEAPPQSPVADAVAQLDEYFAGRLKRFDVPMAPRGSHFQARVWGALSSIAYGETVSYGEIARRIGSAARPVGVACGANPIPIRIPCHRVVAADGRLTGYSGGDGVRTKQALLSLEDRGQTDLFRVPGACYDAPPKPSGHYV